MGTASIHEGVRRMRFSDLLERTEAKTLTQEAASEFLGVSVRTFQRWAERYEAKGDDGLVDRRMGRRSPRRAPKEELERMLGLFRDKYADFTVKHFHEQLQKRHGYSLFIVIASFCWMSCARFDLAGLQKLFLLGMRPKRLVQPRVMRLEMPGEPRIKSLRERLFVYPGAGFEIFHDVAHFVQQTLMIILVLDQLVVTTLAHETLLERKMSRDCLEQIAEEIENGVFRSARSCLVVQTIDEFDELPMLVIDGGDPDAVAVLPMQQAHDVTLSER
jgi:transposase